MAIPLQRLISNSTRSLKFELAMHRYTKRDEPVPLGMLAVDIFNIKKRRPVWHGIASKAI